MAGTDSLLKQFLPRAGETLRTIQEIRDKPLRASFIDELILQKHYGTTKPTEIPQTDIGLLGKTASTLKSLLNKPVTRFDVKLEQQAQEVAKSKALAEAVKQTGVIGIQLHGLDASTTIVSLLSKVVGNQLLASQFLLDLVHDLTALSPTLKGLAAVFLPGLLKQAYAKELAKRKELYDTLIGTVKEIKGLIADTFGLIKDKANEILDEFIDINKLMFNLLTGFTVLSPILERLWPRIQPYVVAVTAIVQETIGKRVSKYIDATIGKFFFRKKKEEEVLDRFTMSIIRFSEIAASFRQIVQLLPENIQKALAPLTEFSSKIESIFLKPNTAAYAYSTQHGILGVTKQLTESLKLNVGELGNAVELEKFGFTFGSELNESIISASKKREQSESTKSEHKRPSLLSEQSKKLATAVTATTIGATTIATIRPKFESLIPESAEREVTEFIRRTAPKQIVEQLEKSESLHNVKPEQNFASILSKQTEQQKRSESARLEKPESLKPKTKTIRSEQQPAANIETSRSESVGRYGFGLLGKAGRFVSTATGQLLKPIAPYTSQIASKIKQHPKSSLLVSAGIAGSVLWLANRYQKIEQEIEQQRQQFQLLSSVIRKTNELLQTNVIDLLTKPVRSIESYVQFLKDERSALKELIIGIVEPFSSNLAKRLEPKLDKLIDTQIRVAEITRHGLTKASDWLKKMFSSQTSYYGIVLRQLSYISDNLDRTIEFLLNIHKHLLSFIRHPVESIKALLRFVWRDVVAREIEILRDAVDKAVITIVKLPDLALQAIDKTAKHIVFRSLRVLLPEVTNRLEKLHDRVIYEIRALTNGILFRLRQGLYLLFTPRIWESAAVRFGKAISSWFRNREQSQQKQIQQVTKQIEKSNRWLLSRFFGNFGQNLLQQFRRIDKRLAKYIDKFSEYVQRFFSWLKPIIDKFLPTFKQIYLFFRKPPEVSEIQKQTEELSRFLSSIDNHIEKAAKWLERIGKEGIVVRNARKAEQRQPRPITNLTNQQQQAKQQPRVIRIGLTERSQSKLQNIISSNVDRSIKQAIHKQTSLLDRLLLSFEAYRISFKRYVRTFRDLVGKRLLAKLAAIPKSLKSLLTKPKDIFSKIWSFVSKLLPLLLIGISNLLQLIPTNPIKAVKDIATWIGSSIGVGLGAKKLYESIKPTKSTAIKQSAKQITEQQIVSKSEQQLIRQTVTTKSEKAVEREVKPKIVERNVERVVARETEFAPKSVFNRSYEFVKSILSPTNVALGLISWKGHGKAKQIASKVLSTQFALDLGSIGLRAAGSVLGRIGLSSIGSIASATGGVLASASELLGPIGLLTTAGIMTYQSIKEHPKEWRAFFSIDNLKWSAQQAVQFKNQMFDKIKAWLGEDIGFARKVKRLALKYVVLKLTEPLRADNLIKPQLEQLSRTYGYDTVKNLFWKSVNTIIQRLPNIRELINKSHLQQAVRLIELIGSSLLGLTDRRFLKTIGYQLIASELLFDRAGIRLTGNERIELLNKLAKLNPQIYRTAITQLANVDPRFRTLLAVSTHQQSQSHNIKVAPAITTSQPIASTTDQVLRAYQTYQQTQLTQQTKQIESAITRSFEQQIIPKITQSISSAVSSGQTSSTLRANQPNIRSAFNQNNQHVSSVTAINQPITNISSTTNVISNNATDTTDSLAWLDFDPKHRVW